MIVIHCYSGSWWTMGMGCGTSEGGFCIIIVIMVTRRRQRQLVCVHQTLCIRHAVKKICEMAGPSKISFWFFFLLRFSSHHLFNLDSTPLIIIKKLKLNSQIHMSSFCLPFHRCSPNTRSTYDSYWKKKKKKKKNRNPIYTSFVKILLSLFLFNCLFNLCGSTLLSYYIIGYVYHPMRPSPVH
jgi:hypothetical protein